MSEKSPAYRPDPRIVARRVPRAAAWAALAILMTAAVAGEPVPTPRPIPGATPGAATAGGHGDPPDFQVVSRKGRLRLYPCTDCHRFIPANPTPRTLITALPHPPTLDHGKGRFWCLACHHGADMDALHTLAGEKLDFDGEHRVCGQCHYARHEDWRLGAHGKRLDNWRGERRIAPCPHCHTPHAPRLEPRKPRAPPPIRAGLDPMTPDGRGARR
uniref:Cytochrome c7 n=1 Tax=Candidatus Kentrum eta TaxID=2126337 RepID=A0A450UHH4_9GAMM|nr:MAG: hypothetical protein BECKH772A_GA0070896_100373 [Candidatus Kentron sp. H]